MATPFAGNVPHYDVIASGQHGGHVAVQVKAVTQGSWQFNIKPFMDVRFEDPYQILGDVKPEPFPGLQVVMVALAGNPDERDSFYVLSWYDLRDLLVSRYRSYLEKHGGRRPRSSRSTHVSLPESALRRYLDRWESLIKLVPSDQANG